jgi:hypothetical protein
MLLYTIKEWPGDTRMVQKESSGGLVDRLYQDQISSIDEVRSKQVNAIYLASAIFGLPPLLASIYRTQHFGFQTVMYVQVGIYLLVLLMVGLRHRLSFQVRTYTLLSFLFVLGTGGLYTWGLLGMGIPFLMSCCVISTVLYGSRAGIFTTLLGVLIIAIFGLLVTGGNHAFGFDVSLYAVSYSSWLLAIGGTALFTSIIVITSGQLYSSLMASIRALSKRTASLQETNQELEKEIARRKESEAELRYYEEQLEEMVDRRTKELQLALANVKMLTGMLPICASCKNIRDDEGYWHQVEVYIRSHSEAEFSHGICPDCTTKLYPELHLKQIN